MVLAHQLAMESPLVSAEMIEAIEFYELAVRYNVSGVPVTVINDDAGAVLGAVPQEYLLEEVKRAIQQ